jgi:hypothetical protein
MDMDYLRACFSIDEFGNITWLERPPGHFSDRRAWRRWCSHCADERVKLALRKGYPSFVLKVGGKRKHITAARLIWAFGHDRWPVDEIDHIDGDPRNNHPSNLREADRSGQMQNAAMRVGKSGVLGVAWNASKQRWRARVKIGGKRYGRDYRTMEEAIAGREALKAQHHAFHPAVVDRPKRDILRV